MVMMLMTTANMMLLTQRLNYNNYGAVLSKHSVNLPASQKHYGKRISDHTVATATAVDDAAHFTRWNSQ